MLRLWFSCRVHTSTLPSRRSADIDHKLRLIFYTEFPIGLRTVVLLVYDRLLGVRLLSQRVQFVGLILKKEGINPETLWKCFRDRM